MGNLVDLDMILGEIKEWEMGGLRYYKWKRLKSGNWVDLDVINGKDE